MKLTIESTTKIVTTNGIPCRIWEGHTESGIPIHCYVSGVAVSPENDCAEFQRELEEQRAPSAAVEAIPLRLII